MKTAQGRAMTLMELIIASVVVTIVMLGVVSANIILQKNSTDYTNRFYVTQTANNVLDSLLADASLAVGTVDCPGIVVGTTTSTCFPSGTGDAHTTCFYQDTNGNGSIQDTINGKWVCYSYPTSSSVVNVYKCKTNYVNSSPYYGMAACSSGSLGVVTAVTPSFSVNTGVFSLTTDNCWNPSVSSCCNPSMGGCTPDVSNPFAERKGSVSPAGQSAG